MTKLANDIAARFSPVLTMSLVFTDANFAIAFKLYLGLWNE